MMLARIGRRKAIFQTQLDSTLTCTVLAGWNLHRFSRKMDSDSFVQEAFRFPMKKKKRNRTGRE